MTLEYKNVVTEGLERLPSLWTDKHNVQGLTKSLLEQVQMLEDVFHELNEQRDIYSAVGVQLDVLGLIIGERRKSRSDTDYRNALLIQIAINNSSGTHDALLNVVRLFQPEGGVSIISNPDNEPAAVELSLISISASLVDALERAAPAGVRVYTKAILQLQDNTDLDLEGGDILELGT